MEPFTEQEIIQALQPIISDVVSRVQCKIDNGFEESSEGFEKEICLSVLHVTIRCEKFKETMYDRQKNGSKLSREEAGIPEMIDDLAIEAIIYRLLRFRELSLLLK